MEFCQCGDLAGILNGNCTTCSKTVRMPDGFAEMQRTEADAAKKALGIITIPYKPEDPAATIYGSHEKLGIPKQPSE